MLLGTLSVLENGSNLLSKSTVGADTDLDSKTGEEILILSVKSILGEILNFHSECLIHDLKIAYNELSFSNLTSILLG